MTQQMNHTRGLKGLNQSFGNFTVKSVESGGILGSKIVINYRGILLCEWPLFGRGVQLGDTAADVERCLSFITDGDERDDLVEAIRFGARALEQGEIPSNPTETTPPYHGDVALDDGSLYVVVDHNSKEYKRADGSWYSNSGVQFFSPRSERDLSLMHETYCRLFFNYGAGNPPTGDFISGVFSIPTGRNVVSKLSSPRFSFGWGLEDGVVNFMGFEVDADSFINNTRNELSSRSHSNHDFWVETNRIDGRDMVGFQVRYAGKPRVWFERAQVSDMLDRMEALREVRDQEFTIHNVSGHAFQVTANKDDTVIGCQKFNTNELWDDLDNILNYDWSSAGDFRVTLKGLMHEPSGEIFSEETAREVLKRVDY